MTSDPVIQRYIPQLFSLCIKIFGRTKKDEKAGQVIILIVKKIFSCIPITKW